MMPMSHFLLALGILLGYLQNGIAAESFFIPDTAGIVFVHRDTTEGSRLEYLREDLRETYHAVDFPATYASFALTQGEDNMVFAHPKKDSLMISIFGDQPVVLESRPNPSGIQADHQSGLIMWMEGTAVKSFVAGFLGSDMKSLTVEKPIEIPDCNTIVSTSYGKHTANNLHMFWIQCPNKIFLVKMNDNPEHLNSRLIQVIHKDLSPSETTALAYHEKDNRLVVVEEKQKESKPEIKVYSYAFNLTSEDPSTIISKKGQKLYKAKYDSSVVTCAKALGDMLYLATYTPGCLEARCRSISRIRMADKSRSDDKYKPLETLVTSNTTGTFAPDSLSPNWLNIKEDTSGNHIIYWQDELGGRVSRTVVSTEKGAPPTNMKQFEKVLGKASPSSVVLDTSGFQPTVIWADHGMNAIMSMSLELGHESSDDKQVQLYKTESPPVGLSWDPKSKVLFWTEPSRQTVVAFDLDSKAVVGTFTFSYGVEPIFESVTFSPVTQRIYVTDVSNGRQILSWEFKKGQSSTEASIVWSHPTIFPRRVLADPNLAVLYFVDRSTPNVFSLFLNNLGPVTSTTVAPTTTPETTESPKSSTESIAKSSSSTSSSTTTVPIEGTTAVPTETLPASTDASTPSTSQDGGNGEDGGQRLRRRLRTSEYSMLLRDEETTREEYGVLYHADEEGSVNDLWINEGNLHWTFIQQNTTRKNTLSSIIQYKPLLKEEKPLLGSNQLSATEFYRKSDQSYIEKALFYQVHEDSSFKSGFSTIWNVMGYVLEAVSIGAIVTVIGLFVFKFNKFCNST